MINETVYQSIFDELSKYLVSGWTKLIVYLEYGNTTYSIAFYVQADGKFTKCYDLPNVSQEELVKSFSYIDKLVSKERNYAKSDLWTNMTMTVSNTGKMKTEFDYTDLSEGTFEFKKQWKEKHLK